MQNIKNVLFPTDFSPDAENALPFALEVAKHNGAKITLFHVIEAPSYVPHNPEDLPKTHSQKARSILERVVNNINSSERYSDLQVDAILQNGTATSEILDIMRESDADLVVMGTKGKSATKKMLFGSIASKIMLEADIPVLAIPPNSSQTTFDPAVFATTHRQDDWPALKQVLAWAKTFHADVNVLHVAEARDFMTDIKHRGFQDFVTEKMATNQQIHFDLVVAGHFLAGLADYLTNHPAGLLVLVRYEKSWIENLTTKNHTKQMSYYTKVPLLVIPAAEH